MHATAAVELSSFTDLEELFQGLVIDNECLKSIFAIWMVPLSASTFKMYSQCN